MMILWYLARNIFKSYSNNNYKMQAPGLVNWQVWSPSLIDRFNSFQFDRFNFLIFWCHSNCWKLTLMRVLVACGNYMSSLFSFLFRLTAMRFTLSEPDSYRNRLACQISVITVHWCSHPRFTVDHSGLLQFQYTDWNIGVDLIYM